MKNALILHGTDSSSKSNWFPWIKAQLESQGYRVWLPDLPGADKPSARRYTEYLLSNKDWEFSAESIIIGHSSGAVAVLALLQSLPESTKIAAGILVASFSEVLADDPEWPQLRGLFENPFDFEAIKRHADKLIFIHSDNDPYCPLEQARYLADHTGGELMIIPGKQHFSKHLDPSFVQFPELLPIIKQTLDEA